MLLMTVAKLLLALASFQDPTPQTPGPMMWTGESESVPRPPEKDAPALAEALRGELKALVTRTDVQRDYQTQLEKLDMLRAVACWSYPYPGKADIAAEIAEVRADWLEKLGRHADAVFAARHVFVMPEEKDRSPFNRFVWVASNGKLAELVNQVDALPRMIELQKRFPSNESATKNADPIEEVVRKEILQGNPYSLKNFGARAGPALAKVLMEDPDLSRLGLNEGHPLCVLLQIDRPRANELILATLGKRGPTWTMQVIYCLLFTSESYQPWAADPDPYTPPRYDDALALRVIDAVAKEGMPAASFFSILAPIVSNGVVTPAIRDFLIKNMDNKDGAILPVLRNMLDGTRVTPAKRELYEAFLDCSDPVLRRNSASALKFYPAGPATLRAVQHTDPNVRREALVALVTHTSQRAFYDNPHTNRDNADSKRFVVQRTPEIDAALKRLARDPEVSVRVSLVRVLQSSSEEPPADLLELLLSDTDHEVRQAAVYSWTGSPELQARVLERLASDSDPAVLQDLGHALWECTPNRHQEWGPKFELVLPALSKWLANPASNFKGSFYPSETIAAALRTPAGARAVFEACTRGPQRAELLPRLATQVAWTNGDPKTPTIYSVLDAASVAELFATVCENSVQNPQTIDYMATAVAGFAKSGELDVRPFLVLARDEARPREVRMRALQIAASKSDLELKDLVFSLLRGVKPEECTLDAAGKSRLALLTYATRAWPLWSRVLGEVCSDPKILDQVAFSVVGSDSMQPALDAASTRACLQRWARLDEDWKKASSGILYVLDPNADAGVLELWKKLYREPGFTYQVVSAMAKFPIDESVPLLSDVAGGKWLLGGENSDYLRKMAIDALTKRLDELGADALLKAISSAPSDEVRKKCFDGLEQIRKYQDEKLSWQKRKGGDLAREQAVQDLLPMLTDKDAGIRAAAARSLATLRAVEHLPKIVALLKDSDATVREAAQKALDALNAPETKKP